MAMTMLIEAQKRAFVIVELENANEKFVKEIIFDIIILQDNNYVVKVERCKLKSYFKIGF